MVVTRNRQKVYCCYLIAGGGVYEVKGRCSLRVMTSGKRLQIRNLHIRIYNLQRTDFFLTFYGVAMRILLDIPYWSKLIGHNVIKEIQTTKNHKK